jgi:hypothetical protein
MNLTMQILQIIIAMQVAFSQARSFKRFGYTAIRTVRENLKILLFPL